MPQAWKISLLALAGLVQSAPFISDLTSIFTNPIAQPNSASPRSDLEKYMCSSTTLPAWSGRKYECYITGNPTPLVTEVDFSLYHHATISLVDLFRVRASVLDQLEEMSEATGNAYIARCDPASPGGQFSTLIFEQD